MSPFTSNVWNTIPLSDYEQHMQHESVGQAQLLNELTKKYLRKYNPADLLFLGVSGGNGLEHVDASKVNSVVGIDVNEDYLQATKNRFGRSLKQLKLVNVDISTSNDRFINADFVWAALIFEYIDIHRGFQFITNNICSSANVIITIQANNGMQSISQTGVESIKSVGQIFHLVESEELLKVAASNGFVQADHEVNVLPNNKSFHTYTFRLKSNEHQI